MNVDTGAFRALTDEVARLGEEVTRLSRLGEALDRHAHNLVIADYLVDLGRMLERDARATRRARPGPRRSRPGCLRLAGGDAS